MVAKNDKSISTGFLEVREWKPMQLIDEKWFKEFVESYRCRICKTPLTLENFGGTGVNHMIFCKDCGKDWEFNTDTQEMECLKK